MFVCHKDANGSETRTNMVQLLLVYFSRARTSTVHTRHDAYISIYETVAAGACDDTDIFSQLGAIHRPAFFFSLTVFLE